MIADRFLIADDLSQLEVSLAADEYHVGTTTEFFTEPGTVTKVYEDEAGPILFVRGTPALRLDIQYNRNNDTKRNLKAMLCGFDLLAQQARANGFKEIIFNTANPLLAKFCVKRFGFTESAGELRKLL